MDSNRLLGHRLRVLGADPALFEGSEIAEVKAADLVQGALLLKFTNAIQIGGTQYSLAVVRCRLQRDRLESLLTGDPISCAMTFVPHSQFNPARPLDLSWWRGGAATIADVVM
jgi:hypothetical protein